MIRGGPASSDTAIPASAIKNGNLTFTTSPATLTAPATVSGATAGRPNDNWTGVNPTLTVPSITLLIEQPPVESLLTRYEVTYPPVDQDADSVKIRLHGPGLYAEAQVALRPAQ